MLLRSLALLCVAFAVAYGGFTIGKTIDCEFSWYNDAGYGACGTQINAETQNLVAASYTYWTTPNPNNDPICVNVCVQVNYNGKSVTVPVKDKCPSCQANKVDLSKPAFAALANTDIGIGRGAKCTFVQC